MLAQQQSKDFFV